MDFLEFLDIWFLRDWQRHIDKSTKVVACLSYEKYAEIEQESPTLCICGAFVAICGCNIMGVN